MSEDNSIRDLSLHSKIMASLSREEMAAMYRYHEIIRFISAIEIYDDVLFILSPDKSKVAKETFKKILSLRNKIAKEHRNKRKHWEELFKENKTKTTGEDDQHEKKHWRSKRSYD